MLSLAVADSVIVPLVPASLALTVGGVVSGTTLLTVNEIAVELALLPAASNALAISVDPQSTRLNACHHGASYAVACLHLSTPST